MLELLTGTGLATAAGPNAVVRPAAGGILLGAGAWVTARWWRRRHVRAVVA